MAFGMIQLAFSACALGESETAYDMLTWLGNSYWNNNMVSTHDPKKTFNVDICGGYPVTGNENVGVFRTGRGFFASL